MQTIFRLTPAFLIIIGLIVAFVMGWQNYLDFDVLTQKRQLITDFVTVHAEQAMMAYVGIYALVVLFSLPGAAFMTVVGGFLFGITVGGLLALIGANIGSILVFLAAKTAFAPLLRERAGGWLKKFQRNFHENAFSYILFLRLIPVFPFWLVNIAPAFFGVGVRSFVTATFIGIIPATFIYAGLGNSLGQFFKTGEKPDLDILLHAEIFWPLVGLAVLALIPVFYKKYRAYKKEKLANDKKTLHS